MSPLDGEFRWARPHAPECRALDNNIDSPRELGAFGERLVDVDGLPRVADADI